VDQVIDGILLRERQPGVLIQPPPVLVGDSIPEQDVQGDYSNLVDRAERQLGARKSGDADLRHAPVV